MKFIKKLLNWTQKKKIVLLRIIIVSICYYENVIKYG